MRGVRDDLAGGDLRVGPGVGRVLADDDLPRALEVCGRDAVAAVLATTRLEQARHVGLHRVTGQVWGYEVDGALAAVCWAGANLVPVTPDAEHRAAALDAFAAFGRAQGRRCSSVVGAAEAVLPLWRRLAPAWGAVREVREDQPSLVIDHEPSVAVDPGVRRSVPEEYDLVLPACVRMFTEEVGYSPIGGTGGAYEARVRSLVREGRSFVRVEPGDLGQPQVVFKAELGAVAGGVAQVQGVWVDPLRRGERLSEGGMAAVVEQTRRDVAPVVSLYANAYNARALAAYRAVGFRQVGTYATVLF
ncbi:GNAT family N-acetyltransferase [Cellulomonas sp. Marseille-Q8402]